MEAPLFCGKNALSGLSALLASALASASAVAFCRQAAWRHGAIGCRTMSSFRNIRDRGGAGPNKPLSSCLAGVGMCCKRQAAWRLNGVVLVIPLGHMLGRRRAIPSGFLQMMLFCICNLEHVYLYQSGLGRFLSLSSFE